MHWLLLLAQADKPEVNLVDFFRNPLFPVMIVVIGFMIFSMRSAARQRREQQAMIAAVKKNDKVETTAGILGVVVAVKEGEDEVTLKVDDQSNTRIRIRKSAIVRVTVASAEEQKEGAAKAS
jgi:preprotein translocase subunit YajC